MIHHEGRKSVVGIAMALACLLLQSGSMIRWSFACLSSFDWFPPGRLWVTSWNRARLLTSVSRCHRCSQSLLQRCHLVLAAGCRCLFAGCCAASERPLELVVGAVTSFRSHGLCFGASSGALRQCSWTQYIDRAKCCSETIVHAWIFRVLARCCVPGFTSRWLV